MVSVDLTAMPICSIVQWLCSLSDVIDEFGLRAMLKKALARFPFQL
jgi:hypothetical protein